MLSLAVRRLAAAVPALLLFALVAAVIAEVSGGGWTDALGPALAALPATAALVVPPLLLGSALGALFGLTAVLRPRSPAGWLGALLDGAGPALPAFLLAAVFATLLKDTHVPLILAGTALAVPPAAQAARLARNALGKALDGALDGVRDGAAVLAARGRGLGNRAVLWNHALPLALGPVAGGLRSAVIATIGGAVAVEGLFGLPGAGRLFLTAARGGDAGVAVAALAALCGLAVLLNAAGAVLHGWLDPRARSA